MGLTSKAKREQMNLASPVYGVLTDAMAVAAGGAFTVAGGIHPKIEPEIAFLIGPSVRGNLSFEQALSAIVGVAPAMEILDSRYVGFKYFSLPDVVADNSSSSHFVLGGEWLSPNGIDLAALTMTMSVDGVPVQSALSAAISGHPVQSLVQLCAMLAEHGMGLPAGSIVLAGAATVAEPLRAGIAVRLDVAQLGSLEVFAR
jgi:2-oxo-3-hexenedioate decarboxylase